MSWKRKTPLVCLATDNGQVSQGKQQQLMTETSWELWRKSVSDITNNLQKAGVKISQSIVHRRLKEQNYRGYTTRCKPHFRKKRKARLDTKIKLYQSDRKAKVWRKEGSAYDPKHTSSSRKYGGGNVMTWTCMAASGTGSLIFSDDITHDGSSRINSEAYRNISSAHVKKKVGTTPCSKTQSILPTQPWSSSRGTSGRF